MSMTSEVADRLVALNRRFYEQFGGSFSDSRSRPQPGFTQLLTFLPPGPLEVLDVGCGDGRFGRFLLKEFEAEADRRPPTTDRQPTTDHRLPITDYPTHPFPSAPLLPSSPAPQLHHYVGIDFSESLLSIARELGPGEYWQRDLAGADCLAGLGEFAVIACLAALHHIPGRANRLRLLREMAAHLRPDGRLFLATWQFISSDRQRRKLRDWSGIGLEAAAVEPGDYLLSWEREGFGLRYVALIDEAAVAGLALEAGLQVEEQFYSDGREGNLSLYSVLSRSQR